MRVLLTGAAGQLGEAVHAELASAHDVVAATRRDLDVTDHAAVETAVARLAPDAIVNCASFNDVDRAESDVVTALAVNAFAVRSLARAAMAAGAVFVHYSTDFVFDGTASEPYDEEVRPNPRSAYSASKLLGDWFAAEVDRHYVLRVESLFGRPPHSRARKSSVDKILDAIDAGREVPVFVDRTVSPSYVVDIARITRGILERPIACGLYHCVNSGSCRWVELAEWAARELGREVRLKPLRLDELQLPAPRPRYCALSNEKLAAAGYPMPTWHDALGRHIRQRQLVVQGRAKG